MTQAPLVARGRKRIKGIKRRRREPDEVATKLQSIRNYCLECCGHQQAEVDRCTAPECWLYPWRHGMTPEAAERQGKEAGI